MIHHDVFPANVTVAPAEHPDPPEALRVNSKHPNTYAIRTARVYIAQDRIIIAADAPEGPVVVLNEPIQPDTHHRAAERDGKHYVTTVSGTKIAYTKDSSCGCGSRLRSWNPTKFATSIKDPANV